MADRHAWAYVDDAKLVGMTPPCSLRVRGVTIGKLRDKMLGEPWRAERAFVAEAVQEGDAGMRWMGAAEGLFAFDDRAHGALGVEAFERGI